MGNSFDERAASWDDNPRRIKLVDEVCEVLNREIDFTPNMRVIDYGCGTGLLGYKLVTQVKEITFCDTSEGMLEQVKKKQHFYGYKNITTLLTDFTTDHLPEQKVEVILSMLVLHHVKEIEKLITKFAELLTPGGLFCWIDLDKEDGSFHNDDTIPHFGFEKEATIQMLKVSGFETSFYTNKLVIQKEVEGELCDFPLFVLIAKKNATKH